jgi:DnaJ like chaperone protein
MSIWSFLTAAVQNIGESVAHFLAQVGRKATAPEKSIAFTIGMIALGAKMARSDGVVTGDEIAAFKQIFQVPDKDVAAVERVFNLAQQDVAGFESYAEQVAKLFSKKAAILENVLDGLFHIAKADNAIHEKEIEFLESVAVIFGFSHSDFERVKSRHVRLVDDPYVVLGIGREASSAEIKSKYRKLVRELHPDKQIAAGVPEEMVRFATERLARINEAYHSITKGSVV